MNKTAKNNTKYKHNSRIKVQAEKLRIDVIFQNVSTI